MKKKIAAIAEMLIILSVVFISISEVNIYMSLKEYGYGKDELLDASLVYYNLSDGFTVEEDGDNSTFIGNHYYIYDPILMLDGYEKADQAGNVYIYENGEQEVNIIATDDWNHWFRVYKLDNGVTIEEL